MALLILFGVVVSIIVVVTVGHAIGSAQNSPRVTPGNNDSGMDCGNLCIQFNNRRAERCVAQADERNAQARIDMLVAQSDSALKTWAIATAAMLAAALIPIIGPLIAIGFATIAAIAFVAHLLLVGAINAAVGDRVNKAATARICLEKEAEARRLLLEKCPNEAGACFAIPSPC